MKCTHTDLTYNDQEYTLIHCVFPFTNVNIVTVKGRGIVQIAFNSQQQILSYVEGKALEEYAIFEKYMQRSLKVSSQHTSEYTLPETDIHFRTAKHTFVAKMKEEPTHYSVKTGGREFVGCVEIMIDKPSTSMKLPSLSQVYSEPECWYKSFENKHDVVDLIKGTLQLCQLLFGTSKFTLDDKSSIECGGGKNLTVRPPRKLKQSLSLAPLSIVKYCKTWYQYNFNAYIDPSTKNIHAFNKGLEKLKSNVDIPFDKFVAKHRLTKEQINFIEPLYEKCFGKRTWLSLFHSIPTKRHCDIFFNWLPSFIDNYIMNGDFYVNRVKWIIDLGSVIEKQEQEHEHSAKSTEPLETMVRTDMYILTDPRELMQWKGGKISSRFTRRARPFVREEWRVLSFSNDALPPSS